MRSSQEGTYQEGRGLRSFIAGLLDLEPAHHPHHEHRTTLDINIGPVSTQPQFRQPIQRTLHMPDTFTLRDDEMVIIGPVTGQDKKGQPVTVATPTFASSDATIAAITDNGDGTATIVAGNLGTAQITVTDADSTDATDVLTATTALTVIPGEAATLSVAFGTPTKQPAAAPAPATT